MKKCPFCKAGIEDNARFCLYCMKPLEEKEVIPPPRQPRKRWAAILLGLAALLLIGCFLGFLLQQGLLAEPKDSVTIANTASSLPDAPETSGNPELTENPEPSEDPEPPKDTEPPVQCDHDYSEPLEDHPQPQCQNTGQRFYVCPLCDDILIEVIPAIECNYVGGTCTDPTYCKMCKAEGEPLGHNFRSGCCTRCNAEDPDYEEPYSGVVYTYREAQAGDAFSAQYTNDGNDIVITGVSTLSPSGEYIVPSYIDGKRVIAIMPNAFYGIDARKVVVGDTIKVIWQYAFRDCINLTDIYFCGNKIDVDTTAFPEADQRAGTLTIHCSATCHNSNMLSYEGAAEYWYDAVYEEWDG